MVFPVLYVEVVYSDEDGDQLYGANAHINPERCVAGGGYKET